MLYSFCIRCDSYTPRSYRVFGRDRGQRNRRHAPARGHSASKRKEVVERLPTAAMVRDIPPSMAVCAGGSGSYIHACETSTRSYCGGTLARISSPERALYAKTAAASRVFPRSALVCVSFSGDVGLVETSCRPSRGVNSLFFFQFRELSCAFWGAPVCCCARNSFLRSPKIRTLVVDDGMFHVAIRSSSFKPTFCGP